MSNERVKPLFEDASASPVLRDFVALARSDGPTQAELDHLAKRLAPVLGVSAGVAIAGQAAAVGSAPVGVVSGTSSLAGALPGAAATGSAGGVAVAAAKAGVGAVAVKTGLLAPVFASAGAKLVALGVGVSVVSVGAWELRRAEPRSSAVSVQAAPSAADPAQAVSVPAAAGLMPAAAARVDESAEAPSAEPSAEPAPASVEVVAEAQPLPLRRPVRARLTRELAPVPSVSVSEPAAAIVVQPVPPSVTAEPPLSELALIRRAQAVRANAGEALALLAQHQQQYPHGALAQEREVLAIELLLKTGLNAQAEARARQFEAAYRGSAHLPHLKALIERAIAH